MRRTRGRKSQLGGIRIGDIAGDRDPANAQRHLLRRCNIVVDHRDLGAGSGQRARCSTS